MSAGFWSFSEGSGGGSFLAFSQLLVVANNPWSSMVYNSSLLISASVFTWPSALFVCVWVGWVGVCVPVFSLVRAPAIGLWPIQSQHDFILISDMHKDCHIQTKLHSEVLGMYGFVRNLFNPILGVAHNILNSWRAGTLDFCLSLYFHSI